MNLEIVIYQKLIRECREGMKFYFPNSWQWKSNAMSIHHYIQKIRELKK